MRRILGTGALAVVLVMWLAVAAYAKSPVVTVPQEGASGQIYLYGEWHGKAAIYGREADLWYGYYHRDGLRHLFLEVPYYTAGFLNQWMQSDGDEILDALYEDWKGSAAYNPYIKDFYRRIKQECPETVFHGTDVGHQYDTTGARYLDSLKELHLEDSDQYRATQEAIGQGQYYRENSDMAYRENKMAENFIREFDALGGESVMGIYGATHIEADGMDYSTQSVPSMANQLHAAYGDVIHSEDLTRFAKAIEPERTDRLTVAGKEYRAPYFGKEDITGVQDFVYREFWRLEDAYEDLKDCPRGTDVLPCDNYPMMVEAGQILVVAYVRADGSAVNMYYCAAGGTWKGRPASEEIIVE